MACPAMGSKSRPPCLRMGAAWSSGRRTNRSSPKSPLNMLPFTKAARLPNIGRMLTAGSSGTSFVNAALACSLGFGIMPGPIRLIEAPCPLRVRDHAATRAAVEGVAPQRLDRVRRARAEGHVLGRSLPRADPCTLVAVLGTRAVNPTGAGERVGDGLGVLVSADDRESVEIAVVVDEVHPTLAVLHGVDRPGATEAAFAGATFRVNMAKTDNPTSRVRRMVLHPPAVMAPPRRSRVVIDVGGLDVKYMRRRLVKTGTAYSGPAE